MRNLVTIEHSNERITITKEFANKANVVGSEEYRTLVRLRQDFPNYSITTKAIKKNASKRKYTNLTYEKMMLYIELTYHKDSPEYSTFFRVKKLASTHAGQYAFVKKWFLSSFPDYNTSPVWNRIDSEQEEYDSQSTDTLTDSQAS